VPQLGNIHASPTYFYIRKNDKGQIEEIRTMPNPAPRKKEFLDALLPLIEKDMPGFKEKINWETSR